MEYEEDGHLVFEAHKDDVLEPLRAEAARRAWRIVRDEPAGPHTHHLDIDVGRKKPLHLFVHATNVIQVQGAQGTRTRDEVVAWAEARGINVTP